MISLCLRSGCPQHAAPARLLFALTGGRVVLHSLDAAETMKAEYQYSISPRFNYVPFCAFDILARPTSKGLRCSEMPP
jgi:hypothetical protein